MDEKIFDEFHQKLTEETVSDTFAHEDGISKLYVEILDGMTIDYENYRYGISKILSSLEINNKHSVSYSIDLFFKLFNRLIEANKFREFDSELLDSIISVDELFGKIRPIFDETYSKHKELRISETYFDLKSLSKHEQEEIASTLVEKLQEDAKQLSWTKRMVEDTLMDLVFLRQLLNSTNHTDIFYFSVGNFIDRLSTSEFHQSGRDISEEIIISSFKDCCPEWGFFNMFRLNTHTGSIHSAILYANLSLTSILKNDPPYLDKFVFEIIWQGMKFFRNTGLMPWAVQMYNSIPKELEINSYERRSLDQTYFTALLKMRKASMPSELLDYLNKNRENILSGGIHDASPWLMTLYNVRNLYPDANFSMVGLGFYVSVFESIVPEEKIKNHKTILFGDVQELKALLKESLIKLNETRSTSDFVYDNESALKISNRLLRKAVENSDTDAFLLSMLIKSDYSLLFQPKIASKEIAPLILPEFDVSLIESIYEHKSEFLSVLPIAPTSSLVCIGFSEGNLYQLELFNNEYIMSQLNNWEYTPYKQLINNDFFFNLSFSDSVKDKSGVRLISPEEFEEEEQNLALQLDNFRLSISADADSVCIVKDMELSKFPHNLFLNQNGDFISKYIPVTNVLSAEWFIQSSRKQLPNKFSKSIWIPIESGDFTLNLLFSNIEESIQQNDFEIFTHTELKTPLSSDINIICSHGNKNISEIQVVYHEHQPTYNLDSIIGKGKILIFFVCYSGSMQTEFYRNNVTSLIKRYISEGYDAVIAPFWALEATIPGYWLPIFLQSLNEGKNIATAVFEANKKVYERYPTPAAWACLHLYGNPNLKIIQK